MANPLVIYALKLHEKICSYHAPSHILYWKVSSTTLGGEYASYPQKSQCLIPWYLSNIIVFGGIFVTEGNFLTLFLSHRETDIPVVYTGFSFAVGIFGVFTLGVNTVFFSYAEEYAQSLNALLRYGKEVQLSYTKRKTKRRNMSDNLVGMFALWLVIFCNIVPFLLVPAEWLAGYDPTLWIFQMILGRNFEEALWPGFRLILLVIRLSLSLAYLSEIYRAFCVICMIMLLEPPIYLLCLENFDKESLDYPAVRKYWNLCRIRNVTLKCCGQMTGILLGLGFVVLIVTHVACLLYWDRFNGPMLGCVVGATIVLDCLLNTVFPWVAKLYDVSNGLVKKWRKENAERTGRRWQRQHLEMLLKATKSIGYRVGNVGVIKQETKLCYYQAVLNSFSDLALALN
ncbi:unnamed protein product [Orchesella dallaii]|uniref:Odorant receptor n=1 Tax=Orchesella dallaii TaxID=48710 RepID=A0ABP1RJU8_9HEXA